MNWINRFTAPTGSLVAPALLSLLAVSSLAATALADAPLRATYQGQTILFTHVASTSGAVAIGVDDAGFQALLHDTGALLTWKPGERYVLITTATPVVVTFALGDRRYDIGPIALQASFAPYQRGNEAYLPLNEVLRALDLAMRQDGRATLLQPQLSSLDVRQNNGDVMLLAHGGAALRPRIVQQSPAAITYTFDGVGTALSGTRQVGAGGVRSVIIANSGTARNPTTLVTVQLAPGAIVAAPRNYDERDVTLAFSANASQSVAAGSPTPEPEPPSANGPAATGPATVTGVTVTPAGDGVTVAVAVTGDAAYEWHRLREPDNRFWIDFKNAQLTGAPIDETAPTPLVSLRARQVDPTTVRVALSLDGQKTIALAPSGTGLQISVGAEDVADQPRSGTGSLGSVVSSGEQTAALVTPAPQDESGDGSADASGWKFGPRSKYVPTNPRLIVIDPGHGGSDRGTIHGGVAEADLTLDMAKRLRDLLVARGWQVKLTHDTDVDVYAPNDEAHQELQARVDVANKAGARLFVSIHVNAFINSGPYGTTTYISKPDDVAFARIVETHLASDGTKDDGIVKSHLYVTLHTRMPAVLVETAFLSNPSDYALLTSSAWRQKVVQEMADGIGQYTQEYPVPNQPSQ
ncbi:MAG TPA: N-acetylmuramoyl-L-alanine amidase [Candidatus Dormibacteraeota bacterium]|nr:N-acetylmuramoyl-L-alanine amidase [Candidatus Dormibacteraeota bacterium]